jgi:hypothetical protein
MLKLTSQSNLDCGFVVAALVGIMYDWGGSDYMKELPIAYKYF